jgi:molecular chaperone GrpE
MTDENDIHIEEEGTKKKEIHPDADTLDDSVITEEAQGETIKKLREKLKVLEAEKQEYLTGWQRAKADLINARKRDEEDKRAFAKRAAEDIVEELIPVLQSFESAMVNKEAWEKIDKNWRVGVESIASQLKAALLNHGLTEIDPLNKEFDPSRDEAIEHVPVNEKNRHNLVIEVLQKGYSLNGRVIRAPRVKVGDMTR